MLAVIWIAAFLFTLNFATVRVGAQPRERTVTEPEEAGVPGAHSAVRSNGGVGTASRYDIDVVQNPSRSSDSVRSSGSVTVGLYRGHTAAYWAGRFRHRTRQLQAVRRTLHTDPHVVEAINLACATYGYCSTLWRKASCETGGTLSPTAYNQSGASGLFQFLGSTWRSTPYGRFSIWSPYANALAAGWMHTHGRGGEWTCR